MSAASDFANLAKLTPTQAIAYLQGRKNLTFTHAWQDLWQAEHAQQFTISRLTRLDLLQAIQTGITKSVNGDLSRRDWTRDTEKLLKDAGWWGIKSVTDPATGKEVFTKFDSARLKLIFDTNTRQAYAAGLWQRIEANKATHPYVRYITQGDERVRASHRPWNGLTLPVDDAFWRTHWPPNGWRCRCRVTSLSQREFDRGRTPTGDPLKTAAPDIVTRDYVNPRSGEITAVPLGIDPGFGYNAGLARQQALEQLVQSKLDSVAPALAVAAREAGLTVPAIAREKPGQDTWQDLGLPSLRELPPAMAAPALLEGATSAQGAQDVLRQALGVVVDDSIEVKTPVGQVRIWDKTLAHVVEKRDDRRERYANFILPTLQAPDEVWATAYDDATQRNRYIKLFSDSKNDMIVIVRTEPNGDIFWNMFQRNRKSLDALRVGERLYTAPK